MDWKSSNFFSPKSPFWNKPAQKVRLVGIKRIFLKKVAFYTFDPSSFFVFFNAYSCVCVWERERKMGRLFAITLEGRIYSCKHCTTHLALSDDIVSKVFVSFPSSPLLIDLFALFFCSFKLQATILTNLGESEGFFFRTF